MKATADHIRTLIGDGLLEDGLQAALTYLQGKSPQLYNECLQHQGRLNECERKLRLGVLSMAEAEQTRAMVRYSLVEVIARQIESDSPEPPPTSPQGAPAAPKREVFQVNLNRPAPVPPPAPTAAPVEGEEHLAPAQDLLNELFGLLSSYDPATAERQVLPLLHPSLLQNGQMRPHFKQNNFAIAHQRCRAYKVPVEIIQRKSTNRRSIGALGNRDEGEEFVFTLAKHHDQGSMPGMVRLFFSKKQAAPKITVISL